MEFKAKDRRLEGGTILRQCQLTQLYLLDIFVEICEKYGFRYFLDSGTLLGAARHGGFIPWDDDLDVGMPLSDYRKFLKVAPEELSQDLILIPGPECGITHVHAKLRDRRSFFCEETTIVCQPSGIYIDIFPYEKSPRLPRSVMYPMIRFMGLAAGSYMGNLKAPRHSACGVLKSGIMALAWKSVFMLLSNLMRVVRLLTPTVYRYSPELGHMVNDGFKESDLFPLSTIEFEGTRYAAPRNVDACLKIVYGDWRTPPPPEKRKWHASVILPTQAPNVWWARRYEPV